VRSEAAGHDIVVVRTVPGLRTSHNVCRHRGSKLVTASGRCDAFACPYHGWRYGLDGTLIATPRFEGVDPTAHGLVEAARVDTWMGLVFVNFAPSPVSLAHWLGHLATEAERAAPPDRVHETNLTAEVACNWKTYVDNYNEAYHVPVLHPALNRDLDVDRYRIENATGISMHHAAARQGSEQPGVFGLRFPNFAFITYLDGIAFMRMEPLGARRTRLVYSHFRPASVSSEAFRRTIDYAWQVSTEDQWIAPLVQDNLERGIYQRGPLNPRHENGVAYMQNLVREALGTF
jgi:choline monooxygenase